MTNRDQTTRWTARPLVFGLAGALVAGSLLLVGCGKEPPPPPPPPSPPPVEPPPPTASFDAISQELGVDPRVQFSGDLYVIDESLARASLSLADALARGDAQTLRQMLSADARRILDDLRASGEWEAATQNIEAVRIVHVGGLPSDDFGSASDDDISSAFEFDPAEFSAEFDKMLNDAPAEQRALLESMRPMLEQMARQFSENLANMGPEEQRAAIEQAIADARANNQPPELIAQLEAALQQLAGLDADIGGVSVASTLPPNVSDTVLVAVQDPAGSYILGWYGQRTGDSWTFVNAPTTDAVRARASAWDGVGLAAVSISSSAHLPPPAPARPAADGDGDSAEPGNADEPDDQNQPGGPRRRNTPHGPVTIPGSG